MSLVSSFRAIKDPTATSAVAAFADDGRRFSPRCSASTTGLGPKYSTVVEDSKRVAGGKRLKEFPDRYHGHIRATRETIDSDALGQFKFDLVVPQGTVIDLSVMCERGQMCGDLQTSARHDAKAPALGDKSC